MFRTILAFLGAFLLVQVDNPARAQAQDSIQLVQQQIAAKNYPAAAATYRRNLQLAFPGALQRDMMKVCKETGDTALALQICRKEQAKAPGDDYWQIREMQFLVYAQQYAAAEKKQQKIRNQQSPDFLEIQQMLFQAQEQWVELLDQQLKSAEQGQYNDDQKDLILFCFLKLKAGFAAEKWVADNQVSLTPKRLFYLQSAQAANWLRWSTEVARNDAEKIQYAKTGLALINQLLTDSSLGLADRKYLAYDRTTAHLTAKQYDSVLLYYQALEHPVPGYVQQAAAQAALELRQPELSARLFRSVLAQDSSNTTALQGLSFALADQNRHTENLAVLNKSQKRFPLMIVDKSTGNKELNDQRFSVDAQLARSLEYAGYLDAAIAAIARLQKISPLDYGLFQLRGNVYAAKGQYQQALQYYDLAYAANPQDAGILYNRSGSFFRQLQFDSVQQILQRLRRDFPFSDSRKRLEKEWKEHNMVEWMTGFEYSFTRGPIQDGNGYTAWTEAATRPMGLFWRVRANFKQEWNQIPEGQVNFSVLGLTAEYRRNNWENQATLNSNQFNATKAGFRLKSVYQGGDHWRFSFIGEKYSAETPFRALYYGVFADRVGMDLGYAPNEKTSMALAANYLPFTDGNRRRNWSLALARQLFVSPHFTATGTMGLGGSWNRQQNGVSPKPIAYFNPANDFAGTLAISLQHQIYRRYEKSFSHQLQLHQMNYRQAGFEPTWVNGFKYQQNIAFNYTKELKWSLGRGNFVFDGVREPYWSFEISFYGRF